MESKKYPRTCHFPFSPGANKDDKILSEQDLETDFINHRLVFTEKLDGSNVCLTNQDVFARSHAGAPAHPSFSPLKQLHSEIKHLIPSGMSIFGEWCFAVHSIQYAILPHHLHIFGIRNDYDEIWFDWNDVLDWSSELRLPTVPVILTGFATSKAELQNYVETLAGLSSVYGPTREGIVVRRFSNVRLNGEKIVGVGKYVNSHFKPGNEHWSKLKIVKQSVILN